MIGRANALPWHLPADLARFKTLTMGGVLIMGRRTYESIGRPLPGRRTIVLTRDPAWRADGVETAGTFDGALERAGGAGADAFVVGGATVYATALPRAARVYLTVVHADIPGDVFFPALDPTTWRLAEAVRHDADARHAYPYSFRLYVRHDARA